MEIVVSGSSEDDVTESLNIKPPQASNSMTQASRSRSPKPERRSSYTSDPMSSNRSRQRTRDCHSRRKHHHHRRRRGYKTPERDLRELLLDKRGERHSSHHSARRVIMSHEGSERSVDKLRVKVERQVVLGEISSKSKHSLNVEQKEARHSHVNSNKKRSSSGSNNHSKRQRRERSVSKSSEERSESESFSSDPSGDGKEVKDSTPKKTEEEAIEEVVVSSTSEDSEEDSDGSSSTKTADTGASAGSGDKEESEAESVAVEDEDLDSLPPYLPAIQGCRSVEEFQCLNKIEEGSFGVVYRARDKRTQEVVALKKLKMAKEKEGFPITALREINTLLKSQHPNIVTVREIVVGSNMDQIFIVMDFVEQDLNALMRAMKKRNQTFLQSEVKCLMQQLLLAVAHLHDNWILHRDLKTSNLLLDDRGVLKVGDFGLAREYGSPLKPYTPLVVTLWYRSPELLLNSKQVYSTHVDMWAAGCVFGELVTLQPMFPGKTEAEQVTRIFKDLGTPTETSWPGFAALPMVQRLGLPTFPVNQLWTRLGHALSDAGMDLMNRFLTYDPAARITAEAALQHRYFSELPVPTLPSKAALEQRKPGKEMKSGEGFHIEKEQTAASLGFSLKF